MTRRDVLIGIVGGLLVIRFIVVPIWSLNDDLELQIDAKEKRFQKGEILLETRQKVEEGLDEIGVSLEKYTEQFPTMDSVDKAQLEVQRRITGLAKEHEITIESAQWVSATDSNPVSVEFEIQFKSTFNNFVNWHLAIEQMGSWISATSFELSSSQQQIRIKRQGDARGVVLVRALFLSKGLDSEK